MRGGLCASFGNYVLGIFMQVINSNFGGVVVLPSLILQECYVPLHFLWKHSANWSRDAYSLAESRWGFSRPPPTQTNSHRPPPTSPIHACKIIAP